MLGRVRPTGNAVVCLALAALVSGGCAAQVDESAGATAEEDEVLDDGIGAADGLSTASDALVAELLDSQERAFLTKLNEHRVANGLSRVRASITLTRAANYHSADMAAHTHVQHESFDGTSTWDRIDRYYPSHGLTWGWLGEIVAFEWFGSGPYVFTLWRDSPGHNGIMLDGRHRVVGISREQGPNGAWYWTGDFGDVKDAILSAGVSSIASNGGFESDKISSISSFAAVRALNRWHESGGTGASASRTTNPFAGSYAMRVVDPSTSSVAVTQLVRALGNVNYKATAAVQRRSGSSQQTLYLDFVDSSYRRMGLCSQDASMECTADADCGSGNTCGLIVRTVLTGTSTSWTRIQVEEAAPRRTAYVRIILYGAAAGASSSTFDWDDVRLTAW